MIANQRTERAHRALHEFLQPKLRPGFALDATPFLIGITDENIVAKIDDVVGAICRATSGDLVCDVSAPELKRKMKQAVEEPDGTSKETKGEIDQNIIDRILTLLECRLTPSELMAVKSILMKPAKDQHQQRGAVRHPDELGEDVMTKYVQPSKKDRDDYASRFPGAMRIKREPACTPVPAPMLAVDGKQVTADPGAYFERFPSARRITQA
jgi:hypothetical protein